nr:Oligopeptide ABC transporter, periplasmic oligopeptide-binding protein OppA (TC 3.A.1.5.1) [uncultured bacterium]
MKRTILTAAILTLALATGVLAAGRTDINIAIDSDIESLHPSDWNTTNEKNIGDQIYDTLMYVPMDGNMDKIEPRIANDYTVSEDGLVYTFDIRDDVTFHDGSPLSAEDCAFSVQLYIDSEYQGTSADVASVEAPDATTLVVTLNAPFAPFLSDICAMHMGSKAYHEAVSEEEYMTKPIGSGPYKFVSHAIDTNVILEAYDGYYRGEPAIQNVNYYVIKTTAPQALMSGQVDFAEVDASALPMLEMVPDVVVSPVPTSGFSHLVMNLEKAPFDDVRVRQAINYAINRDNIVNVIYEGEAEANSNICAKTRYGYSEDQFQYTYDPEKAKELLAEAGLADGADLGTILCAEKYSNLATVLQADLAAVGLSAEIEVKEFNAFIGQLTSGDFTLCALEMTLEGDTQMLEYALTTPFIGMANNARYSDEDMDALFEQARVESDNDARLALFDQILTKAQDEAVYAIICNPQILYAYNKNLTVTDFVLEGNYYLFDYAWN